MSETLINQDQLLNSNWEKPAEWVDLRNCALPDSIYLLVGHKEDYSQYNEFPIIVQYSSAPIDIYIDGLKMYSNVPSDTWTIINWQTLNLSSGFDVTYPTPLRTHVIRIAKSTIATSTQRIYGPKFVKASVGDVCVLWEHITLSYSSYYVNMLAVSGSRARLLEAVTTPTGVLTTEWMEYCFGEANSLREIPIVQPIDGNANFNTNFSNTKVKRIEYSQTTAISGEVQEYNLTECEQLVNTTAYGFRPVTFRNSTKLKNIYANIDRTSGKNIDNFFGGCVSMAATVYDITGSPQMKQFAVGGTSTVPLRWFKGLTVSDSAPFDGASPQIDVSYTGMNRGALINLFKSLPTVTGGQVCDVTGASGAADLSPADLAIATSRGWTITR